MAVSAPHPRASYREQREVEVKAFAAKLRRLMFNKAWNQSDLARASGVGRDMISGYVRAKHLPDPPHAKKLADAFGVEMDDLFITDDPAPAPAASNRPGIELTTLSATHARLYVNLEVPLERAVRVLALLQESPEA